MSIEKFLKITYYGDDQTLHVYLKMPSPTFAFLKAEIDMCLFEQRNLPRCQIRTFWIDEDDDEIEIVNQLDYDIFMANRNLRHHLYVASLSGPRGLQKMSSSAAFEVGTGAAATATADDPSALAIHKTVECDSCKVAPIVGFRYKCIQCANFDLCQRCEGLHKHAEHMMIRMPHDNCPAVVDAFITGRWHRRNKRARGHCAFGTGPSAHAADGTASDNNPAEPQVDPKERPYHHGGRHHRRQLRNGIFTHLYDMMQDLAEGGASSRTEDSSENAAGDAQKAAEVASKAAEAAAKAAHEVASQAAKNFAAAACAGNGFAFQPSTGGFCGGNAFGFKIPTPNDFASAKATDKTAEPKQQEKAENTNTTGVPKTPPTTPDSSGPTVDEPKNTKSDESKNNQTPTTPVMPMPMPSLENLAKFMDPQYMKTGIEILNNFSEMFAKMLDPADGGAGLNCPFGNADYQQRKGSTNSNTSSASSSNSAATPAAEKPAEEKAHDERETDKEPVTAAVSVTDSPNVSMTPVEKSLTPERRRSGSELGDDWQLIDKQPISADIISSSVSASTSTIAEAGATVVLPPPAVEINYQQLSKDLKVHIEEEQKRELERKKQTATVATETANNHNANANIPIVTANIPILTAKIPTASTPVKATYDEKRGVPVYHSDARINKSVVAMMAMGFSNEGAWLTQLLESVNGNIPDALDLMTVAQRNNN